MGEGDIITSNNDVLRGEVIPAKVYLKRGSTTRALDPETEGDKIKELRVNGWKDVPWKEGTAIFEEKRRVTRQVLGPIFQAADAISTRKRKPPRLSLTDKS
jgi:uncharacterized membrane protein